MAKKDDAAPEGEQVVKEGNSASEGEQKKTPESEVKVEKTEEVKPEVPTIPLSDYHNMKDTFSRMVGDDPEKLKEIAEEDPKLAERIKGLFPKRFKDVDLSTPVTDENLDARVAQAVNEALEGSSNQNALASMREQLKMTEIEFSDIKDDLDERAKSLVKSETAKNYVQALGVALQMVSPKLAEDMAANAAVKEAAERIEQASGGSAAGGKSSEKSEEQAIEAKFDKNLPPGFSADKPEE